MAGIKHVLSAMAVSMALVSAAQAAPLEMNFQSNWGSAQKQNADAIEPWAKSFAEKSGGDMVMHMFYVGGIVEATASAEALKSGMLDAAAWSIQDPTKMPYMQLTSIPYLAKDQAHAYRVLTKIMENVPELKAEIDSVGVLLSTSSSAPYMIASRDIPVRSPADIKGKRVLSASPSFGDFIEAWGGIPVTVTPGDIYIGLQRGMGEMFLCGVSCIKGFRVQEICKYLTDLGMASSAIFSFSINRDLFEKDMTQAQRDLTLELSRDLGKNVLDSFLNDVANAYKEFEAAGCQVIRTDEEEMNQFAEQARAYMTPTHIRKAKDAGVADPEAVIKKYMEIAATVD